MASIDYDRACAGCGYNLRGLKMEGRCPECGLHIEAAGSTHAAVDFIGGDEPALRLRMQRGFFLATVGLGGMVAMRLWMIVPFPRTHWLVIDGAAALFALSWCGGVWLTTPRQFDHYGQPMQTARQAARLLALAWPISLLAILTYDSGLLKTASAENLAYQAWQIGRVLGGMGVLVFMYLLVLPAYDAARDDVSKWLITSFWGLLFLSPFIGLIPRGIAPVSAGWVFYGFLAVFIAVWSILAAIAVACIGALYRTAAWKTTHLSRKGGRSERIRETRADIDREVAANIRPLGNVPPATQQSRPAR